MPRLKTLQTNFTSGELDPRLRARRTIRHWFNGARFLRNVILRPQGGVHRRDGSEFKQTVTRTVLPVYNDIVDGTLVDASVEGVATSSNFYPSDSVLIDGIIGEDFGQAQSGTTTNFIVDWGSPIRNITGIKIHEHKQFHFLGSGADRAVTVDIEGSTTGAFSGEEVNLQTLAVTMKAGQTGDFPAQTYDVPTNPPTVAYRYHRVVFTWVGAATAFISEIQFFQSGKPVPLTIITPNGGTGANIVDNDDTTVLLTTTNMALVDPYVVCELNFTGPEAVAFVDIENLKLSAAPPGSDAMVGNFQVQYLNVSAVWTNYGSPFPVINTTEVTRRRSDASGVAIAAKDWRLVKLGTQDGGTIKVSLSGFVCHQELTPLSETRTFNFERSTGTRYVILLSDLNARIFREGAFITDVATPFRSADIGVVDWIVDIDTLLLFHEAYQTHKLLRVAFDDDWSSAPQVFTNIPQFDFGSGDEDTWSDQRGWPKCGTFFQSRLWMAGSTGRPDTVWASKTDDLFNYDLGTTLDDEAIEKTILSDQIVKFHHMFAGRHLYAFGEGAEFYSVISENEALTPSNFALRKTTSSGSIVGVQTYDVDGAVLFAQRGGATIREFIFTDTEAAYQASNVTILSPHLIRTPVDSSIRHSITNDDADVYLLTNADGTLATFTTLRTQEISAWMMQHTDGLYKNCAVDLDDIYQVVERTVGGSQVKFFEKWEPDQLMDCAIRGTVATLTTVISGLDHLEGRIVEAVVDDINQGLFTVASGSITLTDAAVAKYQVGLPFPDVTDDVNVVDDPTITVTDKQALVVELPVEGALPDGTIARRKKRVVRAGIELYQTRHIEIDGDDKIHPVEGSAVLDEPVPLFTGTLRIGTLLGWSLEGALKFTQSRAGEMEILGISKDVSV